VPDADADADADEGTTAPAGGVKRTTGASTASGDRLVLVDDVHTTGATLDAAARALATGGFLQIAAVTYVRTLTDA
jgi:predicted amidophosphoribosyltransferase